MRILTGKEWKPFFENNDGKLFESLTLVLLRFLHPDCEWQPTPSSWDGKRDFFADISKDDAIRIKHWVECKCWSNPLSISAIAATLVVGVAKDAKVITFFSYSRLNENTKNYLSLFSKRTGTQINIYDDCKLEELIVSCYRSGTVQHELAKFFPSIQAKIVNDFEHNNQVLVRQFLSNPYGREHSKEEERRYYRVNDIFTVNYRLENLSAEETSEITITSNYSPVRYKHIKSLNSKSKQCVENLILSPGEIAVVQYTYKICDYKKSIVYPKPQFLHNGMKLDFRSKTLNCKWLADTPLIGNNYIKICDDVTTAFTARGSDSGCIEIIHGRSGTGKSRLLREISDNAILEHHIVFRFNGEHGSSECIDWLRSCISDLYGLPQMIDDIDFTLVHSSEKEYSKIALDILYDKNFSIVNHLKECALLLLDLSEKHDFALFFDNLQFFDDRTLKIIDYMITQFGLNRENRIKLVLGINTDYLFPKTEAKSLFTRLQLFCRDHKGKINLYCVEGFTEGQAEIYIRQCLLCENAQGKSEFKSVIDLLIQKISTLPVAIEQTLFYLEQTGAIGKHSNSFVVNDLTKFHEIIRTIPPNLKSLMIKRWEIIQQNTPDYESIREYLCIIGLLREANLDFLHDYKATLEIVDDMVDIGLLKQTASGSYVLYHNTIGIYFSDIFKKDRIKYTPKLAQIIEDFNWKNIYPAQYFISMGSVAIDSEILGFATDLIIRGVIPKGLQIDFNHIYETALFRNRAVDISKELLTSICILCYQGQVYDDYIQAANRYKRFLNDFWSVNPRCMMFGEIYAEFIREYSSLIILLRDELQCIKIVDNALEKWDILTFPNKNSQQRMRGLLLTRKCAALKSLNHIEEAVSVAEEGLAAAESISDDELYIRMCFDYGYIYYNNYSNIPHVCAHWEKAFSRFESSQSHDAKKLLGKVYFHKALVNTMKHEYSEALKHSDAVLRFFESDTRTPYHSTRIHLLRAIIAMIYPNFGVSASLELNRAEDICIAYNSTKIYFKCLSLKAKYFYLSGENDKTSLYAQRTLEEIYKFVPNERVENKYKELIFDLFFMLRRVSSNRCILTSLCDNVISPLLKMQIGMMIKKSDETLEQMQEEYQSESCFTDPEQRIFFIQP